ncbi:Methyl-accepting chemotaxis protein [Hahella chejuensis KCTC 2396]|uniref:Methyl-accepting chemotaxis protein n=1 Tax=Hahella chejuensis (strain KCTC 2396) TaxID=349521 RepID=Q2SPQ6_HAHCH|nr:methyl-accepting chemotaxis protein [Hahella chejuensis]ABC27368.1 Methyl-accepting chemotaxis protein [Hahella chejuensis KCTC 2396]
MTLKRTLWLALILLTLVFAVIIIVLVGQRSANDANQSQMEAVVTAVRAAGDLDMRHDGIRGVVYQYAYGMTEGRASDMQLARNDFVEHESAMRSDIEVILKSSISTAVGEALENVKPDVEHYFSTAKAVLGSPTLTSVETNALKFQESFEVLEEKLGALSELIEGRTTSIGETNHAELNRTFTIVLAVVLAGLFGGAFGIWRFRKWLFNVLGGEPLELQNIAGAVSEGRLDEAMEERPGIYGRLLAMRNMLREQRTRDQAQMVRMSRLQQAIETASVGLMVADEEFKITYMNPAVTQALKNAEPEIRKRLPQFNADNLIGECIDVFHKNPEHQRRLLTQLNKPHDARLQLGDAYFDLTAGTIRDKQGAILGFVVQWSDISSQMAIEREVQEMVEKAKLGDLKKRIGLEGKEGFVRTLAEGLNELVGVIDLVLEDIREVMQRLAEGELQGRMRDDYQGGYDDLAQAANSSMERLDSIMRQLIDSSDSVRSSNQEISSGNNQLSERTEKQSSSLEETASSIEELSSNVRNTADNARQADQLSNLARDAAATGGEVTKRTVASMGEINEASRKIAEIIGVIDDIAFQTNLLALNASVEAARAGDQGRGFAVVATEVRNLAQRSATSAREIKDLIEDSVKKVQAGSKLVDESGKNLDEIILHVKKVSDLISDIAAATEEQSSGLAQVNKAVMELDEITQQNAALAEETASSAESSLDSVEQMVQLMSFFKVDGGQGAAVSAPKAASRVKAAPEPVAGKASKPASKPASKAESGDEDWEVF